MKYKNIAINETYNSRVEELAALFSKDNKGKLIEIMADYFKTTGIDPRDLEGTTFKKEFKKLDDNISKLRETTVSFIRQQEKGFLKPMIEQVNTNTQQLLIYLSQEPLTVKHLEEFKSMLTAAAGTKSKPFIERSENQETKQPGEKDFEDQIQNIKAKAEMGIAEAKNIFGQFVKTGKKSE